jgi:hypothetical protein
MNKKFVRHDVDLANLPPLTEAQRVQLAALKDQPDSEINHSEIALLAEDF